MRPISRFRTVATLLFLVLTFSAAQQLVIHQSNGSFPATIHDVCMGPGGSLLVASSEGLFHTIDAGRSFRPLYLGPDPFNKEGVSTVASTGDTIVAGTYSMNSGIGTIAISLDGGGTWNRLTNSLIVGRRYEDLLLPTGTAIFAGGMRIFRSIDGGANWSVVGGTLGSSTRHLIQANDGSLIALTSIRCLRSTDFGVSWAEVTGISGITSTGSLFKSSQGSLIVSTSSLMHRSTDHGVTWTPVDTVSGFRTFAQLGPGAILAFGQGGPTRASTDDGNTWTDGPPSPAANPTTSLNVGDSLLIVGNLTGAFVSEDSGTSWRTAGTDVILGPITGLAVRGPESILVIKGHTEVYESSIPGLWTRAMAGLPDDSLQSIATLGLKAFAGTAHNGLYRAEAFGAAWQKVGGGFPSSGRVRAIRHASGGLMLAAVQDGLYSSTDSGATWNSVAPLSGVEILGIAEEVNDTIYLSTRGTGVYRSSDGGASWASLASSPMSVDLVSTANLGDGVVLAGTTAAGLFRSTDGGGTWSAVTTALNGATVQSLLDAGIGYVYAGSDAGLFYSSDGGETWVKSLGSLADIRVTVLALDGGSHLLVGSDSSGIYISETALVPAVVLGTRWMNVGSLHDWFSSTGTEIEHGLYPSQQCGLQWPAIRPNQDMKASKAFWIGTTDWTDGRGVQWPVKVVHAGPRVDGIQEGEFFPLEIKCVSRLEPTEIFIDGILHNDGKTQVDAVDSTLRADREIVTRANTAIGISVERRILAFSQDAHDNYFISEYEFRNTGNTDVDKFIEIPNATLTNVYFYFFNRYAVNRSVRYIVNNSTGWGINTMNDTRGFPPDIPNVLIPPTENDVKAQFAWHGYHNQANKPAGGPGDFDNIGVPVFDPSLSAGLLSSSDSTWRLGGHQFVGLGHVYADRSPQDKTNDPDAPSTSNFVGSDEGITRNNSQFDAGKMTEEFARMSEGHHSPRHAWEVVPDGNFGQQALMANIGIGAPGGWSAGIGYGPYTLGPGESIKIVFADGAAGLTEEESDRIGRQYRAGTISTVQKNDSVLTKGRSRILSTFRRAKANYETGFIIPRPPLPPSQVSVERDSMTLGIHWIPPTRPGPANKGYEVYRRAGDIGGMYELVYAGDDAARSFTDSLVSAGVDYYYYVVSVGDSADNDGTAMTPLGALRSGRYSTQTWDPVRVRALTGVVPGPGDGSLPREFRLYDNFPNPFNPSTTVRFALPQRSNVSIRVYNVIGQLMATIAEGEYAPGVHETRWVSTAPSGMYFLRIEATPLGAGSVGRFVEVKKMLIVK